MLRFLVAIKMLLPKRTLQHMDVATKESLRKIKLEKKTKATGNVPLPLRNPLGYVYACKFEPLFENCFDFMKFLPSLYLNISNIPYISTRILLHEVGFSLTFDSPV